MVFVYYSGSGYLVNRPSLFDHIAAKEITHGTYQGIFALSDADEKELHYTEKVTINYLELTNHKDKPELADVLHKLSTELESTKSALKDAQPLNVKFEELSANLKKLEKDKQKRIVFMMTTAWRESIKISLKANQKHYETEEGNKLSILDSQTYQKNEQSNLNHSSMLTAVNQASIKFWNNADRNDQDTWSTNQVVIDWLMKEHKFSQNIAKAAATIVRPEWAKK